MHAETHTPLIAAPGDAPMATTSKSKSKPKTAGASKTAAKPKTAAAPKTAAWMAKTAGAAARAKTQAARPRASGDLVFRTGKKIQGLRTVAMLAQIRGHPLRQVVALPDALVDRLRGRNDCDGPWSSAIGALALFALRELDRQGLRLEIREPGDEPVL